VQSEVLQNLIIFEFALDVTIYASSGEAYMKTISFKGKEGDKYVIFTVFGKLFALK
jgi:hypothetical protein